MLDVLGNATVALIKCCGISFEVKHGITASKASLKHLLMGARDGICVCVYFCVCVYVSACMCVCVCVYINVCDYGRELFETW